MTLNPKSDLSLTGRNMSEAIESKVHPDYVNRFPLENLRGAFCHYPANNKLAQSSLSQSEPFLLGFIFKYHEVNTSFTCAMYVMLHYCTGRDLGAGYLIMPDLDLFL